MKQVCYAVVEPHEEDIDIIHVFTDDRDADTMVEEHNRSDPRDYDWLVWTVPFD